MNNKILRPDASMRKTGSYSRELTENIFMQFTALQSTSISIVALLAEMRKRF